MIADIEELSSAEAIERVVEFIAPKSGTTWLKALSFAIVTRNLYDTSNSPLLTKGPHYCVPDMVGFEHKPDIRQPAKQRPKENEHISIEEAFELFCQGRSVFGPAWDHILVIGKLVKNDRKSFEEEQGGQVKKLIDLCSFENLSNLDVNKTGKRHEDDDEATNKTFFRKG
ncbi:hypothetical protein V6Z11_D01G249700 [Gossypium hirsutum]